jgi:hypothetical protein
LGLTWQTPVFGPTGAPRELRHSGLSAAAMRACKAVVKVVRVLGTARAPATPARVRRAAELRAAAHPPLERVTFLVGGEFGGCRRVPQSLSLPEGS